VIIMTNNIFSPAMKWLCENTKYFKPVYCIDKYGNEAPDEQSQSVLTELALVCRAVKKSGIVECSIETGELLKIIYHSYNDPRYCRFTPDIAPQAFIGQLYIWGILTELGFDTRISRDYFADFICSGDILISNQVPFRKLELLYLLIKNGFFDDPGIIRDLYERTFLRLFLSSEDDGFNIINDGDWYDITHTIFYLTDFGAKPACEYLSGGEIQSAKKLCVFGAEFALDKMNPDIACELIVSYLFLNDGKQDEDLYKILNLWEKAKSFLHGSGCMPDAGMPPEIIDYMYENNLSEELFNRCYHPTLVAVMAAAAAVERGLF